MRHGRFSSLTFHHEEITMQEFLSLPFELNFATCPEETNVRSICCFSSSSPSPSSGSTIIPVHRECNYLERFLASNDNLALWFDSHSIELIEFFHEPMISNAKEKGDTLNKRNCQYTRAARQITWRSRSVIDISVKLNFSVVVNPSITSFNNRTRYRSQARR